MDAASAYSWNSVGDAAADQPMKYEERTTRTGHIWNAYCPQVPARWVLLLGVSKASMTMKMYWNREMLRERHSCTLRGATPSMRRLRTAVNHISTLYVSMVMGKTWQNMILKPTALVIFMMLWIKGSLPIGIKLLETSMQMYPDIYFILLYFLELLLQETNQFCCIYEWTFWIWSHPVPRLL